VRFPERISALIMNGPMPVTEEERQNFMDNGYVREVNMVAESGGDYLTRVFAARERLAAGTLPLDRIGNFVIQAFMGRGKYFYGHHAAFQYRQDEALPKIAVPAMILTNTGDMIYDHALRAHAIRPDITLVELDGGGVDIVDQQPEQWADAVAAFLNA
jgi:pimeloyl-ACP methyl ester carboxylesterase